MSNTAVSAQSPQRQRWEVRGGFHASGRDSLTPTRRFQSLEQQRQQGIDPSGELWVVPFVGMGGMMETDGGVENRARRGLDVGDMERALLHAVGQNMRYLTHQAFLVRLHH